MARPSKFKQPVRFWIKLEAQEKQALQAIAEQENRSTSDHIRHIIQDHLNNTKLKDPKLF